MRCLGEIHQIWYTIFPGMKFMTIALLLLSVVVTAQTTPVTLAFEKGRKMELTLNISNTTATSMGDSKVEATIIRSFDIEDVVNGNARIEHKIKRVMFNLESPMANFSFDSDKEDDRKSNAGKALEKTLKNKYSMTVSPQGIVTEVKLDDTEKGGTPSAQDKMILGVIEQMAGKIEAPTVGQRFELTVLPGVEAAAGSGWSDTTATHRTQYTVSDINDGEIWLNYKQTGKMEHSQEVMNMPIVLSTAENTTGIVRIDKKTGLLRDRTANTSAEGTMNMMGQSSPLSVTSVKKWTVK